MSRNIIDIQHLTKRFGAFTAVDDMHLEVREGEIFGFLGPNGAGKTTTISILTTLIKPTRGTAIVDGHDIREDAIGVRSVIGVVPQSFALFPELTAEENLAYIGRLYGLSEAEIKKRSDELLETVSLSQYKDRIAGIFSSGMKQRLSLAASIISNPKILFMDEPTTGLDPQSRIAMRELTKKLNRKGMTIIYTTHDMDEAEKICDRITIMDEGCIVADGTAKELKKLGGETVIEIELAQPDEAIVVELQKLRFVTAAEREGKLILLRVKRQENIFYELSDFFRKRKRDVHEIRFKEPTLEEVFIKLTQKELRD